MDFDHSELSEGVRAELAWILQYKIKGDRTPGFPMGYVFHTNEKARQAEFNLIVNAAFDRIELLSEYSQEEILAIDPVEAVRLGLADVCRVFVKQEPHSDQKIKSGMLRIIFSVSILDQMIERLLYRKWQEWCIQHYRDIPMKPGWGDVDQDWADFEQNMRLMHHLKSSDCSGFDLSNNEKQQRVKMEIRARTINFSPLFEKVHRNYSMLRLRNLISLSNGAIYKQISPGIEFSGRYETGSGNSEARAFLAFEAALDLAPGYEFADCMTMGDDCVEDNPATIQQLEEWYAKQGFLVKMNTKMEFCSHEITESGVEFQNVDKTIFRLACDPSPDHYDQIKGLFRTKEQLQLVKRLAVLISPAENI